MSTSNWTSGWNYPSGSRDVEWDLLSACGKGRRPKGEARAKFDELSYYAERFDTVEINTTFYGQPKPAVAQTWVDRTPPHFEFSLKLYRHLTHAQVPGVPQLDATLIDEYRRGIEPLAQAGKLGALLAQFPPSFKYSAESQEYLDALLAHFHDYPVAVELRHRSWSDHFSDTLSLLNARKAAPHRLTNRNSDSQSARITAEYHGFYTCGFTAVTPPNGGSTTSQRSVQLPVFGRRAQNILRDRQRGPQTGQKVLPVLQHHFASKAVVNALMIKKLLDEPIDGVYPPAFVDAYPEMATIVSTKPAPQLVLAAPLLPRTTE